MNSLTRNRGLCSLFEQLFSNKTSHFGNGTKIWPNNYTTIAGQKGASMLSSKNMVSSFKYYFNNKVLV